MRGQAFAVKGARPRQARAAGVFGQGDAFGQDLLAQRIAQPRGTTHNRGAVAGRQKMADQAGTDPLVKQHGKAPRLWLARARTGDGTLAGLLADLFGGGQIGLKGAAFGGPVPFHPQPLARDGDG